MANIRFQLPSEQPTGRNRLLAYLLESLRDEDLAHFRIIVAFAKLGPLRRLDAAIQAWRQKGKLIEAIVGIDHRGTSREALEYALANFDTIRVMHVEGPFTPTFHPKVYMFTGGQKATAYIGSSNLTVGGSETNFEAGIMLTLQQPEDRELRNQLNQMWDELIALGAVPLTKDLLEELAESGLVLNEAHMRMINKPKDSDGTASSAARKSQRTVNKFPSFRAVPSSPLPKPSRRTSRSKPKQGDRQQSLPAYESSANTLIIQIIPHHNGEIFLSTTAVNQNQTFFGFPFSGRTTPKKPHNPAYPQRTPDPRVSLAVYNADMRRVVSYKELELNMVYYKRKSDLRITVPRDVIDKTPPYSILVMESLSTGQHLDYNIKIYAPGSQTYNDYLDRCNQKMPSGGKPKPRRFGWL